MNDRKIERSDGRVFGRLHLLANSIEVFIANEEKKLTRDGPKFTKHQNLFDSRTETVTESVSQKWWHVFLKRACRAPQRLARRLPPTWKRLSCAGARPQELCH